MDSVLKSVDRVNEPRFHDRQGPELGAWNYPDALFTGSGGMTDDEYRYMQMYKLLFEYGSS